MWDLRSDSYLVWKKEEVIGKISWYRSVMLEEKPPKYVICRSLRVENFEGRSEEKLWEIHREASEHFKEVWKEIKEGKEVRLKEVSPSYLDLKVEIANRMLRSCRLCSWKCGVDRTSGLVGRCKVPGPGGYVDTYFLHMGEEAPLVPSGTIFYSGCNFSCVYCQNWSISQKMSVTSRYSGIELARIQKLLRKRGARNANHVGGDPTPNLPVILKSMKYLEVWIPQLWNSNMYLSEESMNLILDVIDIWLPDFKYGNDECARRLSMVEKYFEIVTSNLRKLREEDVIVRHLVLPNHIECCTAKVIKWLRENLPSCLLNLMDQYRPDYLVIRKRKEYSEISRPIYREEFQRVCDIARKEGWKGPIFDLWYL